MLSETELNEIEILKAEMEKFIKTNCTNALEAETVRKRLIEGKRWKQVADELFELTEDAPRKRVYRALNRKRH